MTATTAVRERPILFSAEMVRLLLAGEKTQTRRVVKLPKHIAHDEVELQRMQDGYADGVRPVWEYNDEPNAFSTRCPFGAVGDRLWVRERFMPLPLESAPSDPAPTDWLIDYAADGRSEEKVAPAGYNPMLYNHVRYTPSIFMPRWASRLTLDIAGVRVERLQEISESDAKAEGVEFDGIWWRGGFKEIDGFLTAWPTATRAFEAIWRTINGEESWAQNPWVWVVSFAVVPQNGGAA
jgi:hypothetical protein